MATEEARTRTARRLAEEALVRLAVSLGEHCSELIVIGGLAPDLLTESGPVPHQGTTDVDILLSVGFVYDRDELDFAWLETALEAAGFKVDELTRVGWRWTTLIDGVPVKLELLCDVYGDYNSAPVVLPGCQRASAMNLQGPGAAMKDAQVRELLVPADLGGGRVAIKFAGLGGFLMAKASAAVRRQLPKDFYDFAYVLLYNRAGGPKAAADELLTGPACSLFPQYSPSIAEMVGLFTQGDRVGARHYADTMMATGDTADYEALVEDAVGAALEFWSGLEITAPGHDGNYQSGDDQ